MKKIITIVLSIAMILTSLALIACGNNEPATLKLGLGIVASAKATSATEEVNGQGTATFTAAAVLVDAEGKIVKAFIDCADFTVDYTADGKAVANSSLETKYEKGANYNMVAYGGAAKEWFEQADAFCSVIVGKTATEVLALVAETAKGTDEVINAGCTIYVSDFAKAVEKAIANAADSNATANDTVKIGVATTQTTADATEEKKGSNKVATTFFAAAVNAEGKVVAASTDCVEASFGFDATGASDFDATKAISTKKELGANYGMVAYAGAAHEWFEQAAAFDAACLGKTASEISGLVGNADLQAAGCTIDVNDFVKAAAKVAK